MNFITNKQQFAIDVIECFSEYKFKGKTKQDAIKFIGKYIDIYQANKCIYYQENTTEIDYDCFDYLEAHTWG